MKTIGTISGEGFACPIREDKGRVWFTADADIDADGANGQSGAIAAYRADNKGSEHLANGGMKVVGGKVVFAADWGRNIVVVGKDNQPLVLKNGVIPSKTWYVYPGYLRNDPCAYVDSETVPYIVVPPLIVQQTVGAVRGCRARATYKGKVVDCVVADLGPRTKVGEVSIALARALGIPSSPRTGGSNVPDVLYELWPGQAAPGFVLQPA